MARSERQEDGTRGGVGTMASPGTRPRPQQAGPVQRAAAGPRDQQGVPAQRAAARRRGAPEATVSATTVSATTVPATTVPATTAPGRTGPRPARTTGPQPAVPPAQQAPAGQAARTTLGSAFQLRQAGAAVAGSHRMPFVLLLCGLLGGALVSALVISTTLAEGSYQITKLQDSTSSLAKQRQTLQEEVAQGRSAQTIEQRASQLGMRRVGELRFVDLKSGKVTTDGPTWSGAANAPGYAP